MVYKYISAQNAVAMHGTMSLHGLRTYVPLCTPTDHLQTLRADVWNSVLSVFIHCTNSRLYI